MKSVGEKNIVAKGVRGEFILDAVKRHDSLTEVDLFAAFPEKFSSLHDEINHLIKKKLLVRFVNKMGKYSYRLGNGYRRGR